MATGSSIVMKFPRGVAQVEGALRLCDCPLTLYLREAPSGRSTESTPTAIAMSTPGAVDSPHILVRL